MAYFRVTQKQSGGGGATITVSYASPFYGKTITCSDGVTTYTKTTTSSGTTTFDVEDEGTWTITCDGVTKTVIVVLDYSVAMTFGKTITVYSAANDTLSFTDASGSKTVTTDSSGQGSVSIVYNDGDFITFTSTVANDPNDLSSYYSKTIQLHTNTTEVYVMPDNTLYWWGFKGGNLEDVIATNGWYDSGSTTVVFDTVPTYNTNDISAVATQGHICGVGTKNTVSVSSAKCIAKGDTMMSTNYGSIVACDNKNTRTSYGNTQITSNSKQLLSLTPSTSPCSLTVYAGNARAFTLYAFWYD